MQSQDQRSTVSPGARRRRRLAIFVALLGVGAFGVWLVWQGMSSQSMIVGSDLTYQVKRGDLRISCTERGSVRAASSVAIYSRLEGENTIVSLVPEGTNVRQNDLLVELDASNLQQILNQQQIAVDTAAADYLQAEEQLEIQKSLSESEIQKAALELELGELDLERYLSPKGEYELALMKSGSDVMIAEEELTRARNTLEWTQKLAEKGYVSGTELIADKLSESKAKVHLEQAKGDKALLEKYTHKKDLAKNQATVREARSALDRAQRKSKATIAQSEASKRGKESTLNLSRRRLEKITDQLEKATIRAPADGMVVYASNEWRRDRMIMQGSVVHENQLLMNLSGVSTMAVDVQVHESWIDQIKDGLPVLVSTDALPNLKLKGNVTKVGILPDSVNRWINPDLKVYKTEVTLEESADSKLLRPGMSAKVEILVAVLSDALFVPVQSVSSIDREQVCYVLAGREFVPRPVTCGRSNSSFIEVLSGLNEGDVIQFNAPTPKGMKKPESETEMADLAKEIAAAEARTSAPERAGQRSQAGDRGERKGKGSGGKKRTEGQGSVEPAVLKDGSAQSGGAQ